MSYSVFKEKLFELLVDKKQLTFGKLAHQYYSLPIDRILVGS